MSKKRILIIANKNWEADPLMNILLQNYSGAGDMARPKGIYKLQQLFHPPAICKELGKEYKPSPRAIFHSIEKDIQIEVWCVQDLLDPTLSSNSKEKAMKLPLILNYNGYQNPDFVIASGTAGFPDTKSYNGCVIVGSNVFISNASPSETDTNNDEWFSDLFDKLLPSSVINTDFFNRITYLMRYQCEAMFLTPDLNPADKPILIIDKNYIALSVVNVKSYSELAWADKQGIEKVQSKNYKQSIGSVETTHGITRSISEAPFIFVSGITDRVGYFNMEVTSHLHKQNFTASHNAGVVIAWLIPEIIDTL